VSVVFYDPGAISRAIWIGSAIIAVSIVATVLWIYSSATMKLRFFRAPLITLLSWLVLFIAQMSYIASYPAIIYATVYNASSSSFVTYSTSNPVMPGVVAVTIVSSLTAALVIVLQTVYGGSRRYLEVRL
jgi:glucan phosphoethanolaminetransferase (alkaline phosphatase superfamily)